jgi:hypothetical protein
MSNKRARVEPRPYALGKAKLNPGDVVGDMSQVQKLVYLAGQMDSFEAGEWADEVFDMRRHAYESAIEAELALYGCGGKAYATTGPELRKMRQEANTVGAGIANTYNYWLAREIVAIGEDTPTANRHVYAHRLFYAEDNWAGSYWAGKQEVIGATETASGANWGLESFYRNNGGSLDDGGAEVVPYPTVCPVCASYVEGNPYKSMEDLYNKCMLPAHPHCPHFGTPIDPKRLSAGECAELWRG